MFIERKMLSTLPFWLLTAKPLFQARCRQFVTFSFFACFSVHHLLVCNFGRYDFCRPLLSTSPSVWGSLDHTSNAAPSRIPLNGDATSRLISTYFHKISFDPNYSQLRSLTQNPSIYIYINKSLNSIKKHRHRRNVTGHHSFSLLFSLLFIDNFYRYKTFIAG